MFNLKKYSLYILALVGLVFVLINITNILLKILAPFHGWVTKLYQYQIDPYNLVFSTFLAIIGIYIAFKANQIADRSLEQNRPQLVFNAIKVKDGLFRVNVNNNGNFEASRVNVFYKNLKDLKLNKISYNDIFLSPSSGITVDYSNIEDQSTIVLYKNALTGKNYIIGSNIILDEGEVVPFDTQSAITNKEFISLLEYSKNKSFDNILKWLNINII